MYNTKTCDRLCTINEVVEAINNYEITITSLYDYLILSNNQEFLDYCSYNEGAVVVKYINIQKLHKKNGLLSAENCEMLEEILHCGIMV